MRARYPNPLFINQYENCSSGYDRPQVLLVLLQKLQAKLRGDHGTIFQLFRQWDKAPGVAGVDDQGRSLDVEGGLDKEEFKIAMRGIGIELVSEDVDVVLCSR